MPGLILDTPGIRTLGLWEAEHALDLVFGDLVELAEQCRFGIVHTEVSPAAQCRLRSIPAIFPRCGYDFLELVDELDNLRKREAQRARREKGGGRRRR